MVRSSFARASRRTPFTTSKSPPTNRNSPLTAKASTGRERPSVNVLPGPSMALATRAANGSRDAFSVNTAASDPRAVPFTEEKAPPT